jgi:hypothetical protein
VLIGAPDPAFKPRLVLEENGRKSREMNDGIEAAMKTIAMVKKRLLGEKYSLTVCDCEFDVFKVFERVYTAYRGKSRCIYVDSRLVHFGLWRHDMEGSFSLVTNDSSTVDVDGFQMPIRVRNRT